MMKVLRWCSTFVQGSPAAIVAILDWVVAVIERMVVIAVALIAFYSGWLAFHEPGKSDALTQTLKALSEYWKGLLLLLIPLFYRTVRTFLEKVRKFAGMETETEEKRTANPAEGE